MLPADRPFCLYWIYPGAMDLHHSAMFSRPRVYQSPAAALVPGVPENAPSGEYFTAGVREEIGR